MKAEVVISDIGPFKGRHSFVLDSDELNVVEAPNASGKSSFIKGLAALLGLPAKSRLSDEVSRRLGLVPTSSDTRNPLVNVELDKGSVELKMGGTVRALAAPAYGRPRTKPDGNERFLLTGLLLRESEIVRRLDEGFDDFSWLVSSLSLSSAYEHVRAVVQEYQTETRDRIEGLKEQDKSISSSKREVDGLRKKRDGVKERRSKLDQQLSSILKPDAQVSREIDKLRKARNDKESEIEASGGQIHAAVLEKQNAEASYKLLKGKVSGLEAQSEQIGRRMKELPNKKSIEEEAREAARIRKDVIPDLKEEVGRTRADFDLLAQAEKHVKGARTVPCPLCQSVGANPVGMVPVAKFTSALEESRRRYLKVQGDLARAIQKADDLDAHGNEVDRTREKLTKEQTDCAHQLAPLKTKLLAAQRSLDDRTATLANLESDVSQLKTERKDIRQRLAELELKYGGEKRQKIVDEMREVESDLGGIEAEISKLEEVVSVKGSVDVLGQLLDIGQALSIYQAWFDMLAAATAYVDDVIAQQRQGAARAFNEQVDRLITEMTFKGLEVWIDEQTYRLKVQRKASSGVLEQAVSSLSTSERHSLAAVLTLAAKEAYAPDIPFFLVDEVLLDFDRARLAAFLKYLRETALKRKHLVVISKLGGSTLRVRAWGSEDDG